MAWTLGGEKAMLKSKLNVNALEGHFPDGWGALPHCYLSFV
jgi:hypothetical protein